MAWLLVLKAGSVWVPTLALTCWVEVVVELDGPLELVLVAAFTAGATFD